MQMRLSFFNLNDLVNIYLELEIIYFVETQLIFVLIDPIKFDNMATISLK